jgi:hypothetical protein
VIIHDTRTANGEGETTPVSSVATLEHVHNGKPHSVQWNPWNENELLTAGLDDVIQCWDLRKIVAAAPSNNKLQPQPLHEY